MTTFSKSLLATTCVAAALLASTDALHAANVTQIASVPSSEDWNSATGWGSVPTAGSDYFTAPLGSLFTAFTLNGITWQTGNDVMRDSRTSGTTFAGDSLHLVTNGALLSKIEDGLTNTANIVFDGGFIRHAGNNSSNGDFGTLDGTISFGTANVAAIAIQSAGNFTFNIASTIVGDSSRTLQLALAGLADRVDNLRLTGDLTGFAGTFYLGMAGNAAGSAFSIQSSAPLATVEMATSPNFLYDLTNDVAFGSMVIGGELVTPGVYDDDALNAAYGSFFFGDGTITVVPEPSTLALLAIGVAGVIVSISARSVAGQFGRSVRRHLATWRL